MAEFIAVFIISIILGFGSYKLFSLFYTSEMERQLPTQYKYTVWVGVCLLMAIWYYVCKVSYPKHYIFVLIGGAFLLFNMVPMAIMDAGTKTVYMGNVLFALLGAGVPFIVFLFIEKSWYRIIVLVLFAMVSHACSLMGGYKLADHYILLSCVMVWLMVPDWDSKILMLLIAVALVHGICFLIPFIKSKNKREFLNPFIPSTFISFFITFWV